jgi:hypothetical protein
VSSTSVLGVAEFGTNCVPSGTGAVMTTMPGGSVSSLTLRTISRYSTVWPGAPRWRG